MIQSDCSLNLIDIIMTLVQKKVILTIDKHCYVIFAHVR